MVQDVTTGFIQRLRARDPQAWYELWEIFGPVLRAQFARWGRGRIGAETVKDLSQETMAALATAIDSHDPTRGVRFSTWLLAIAKYTLTDEFDRRMAQKRGSGKKPQDLETAFDHAGSELAPDDRYEGLIIGAKVEAALRAVERECELVDFEVYRMRVLENRQGKDVAVSLGLSEPAVSRRLGKVRDQLRTSLGAVMARFSFTDDELQEANRKGLDPNPNKASDALFDEAVAEVYHRYAQFRSELDRTR
jgi:RNA polymerase sigma factor (sigma-70 family)